MFCQPAFEFFSNNLNQLPYNYLEIGVFNGDSIAGIAKRFPHKIVFAIDPFLEDGNTTHTSGVSQGNFMPTQHKTTYDNINGLENIVLFEMTSKEFDTILTDEMVTDMNVGYVLIDGSHHYDDVILDAHMAMRIIGDKKGIVIFDDVGLPGVNQAYNEWQTIYKDKIKKTHDIYNLHPNSILVHEIN